MGPYAGVASNLIICRLKHIYHGQPYDRVHPNLYVRVDLNSLPESTLSPSQGLRIWPLQRSLLKLRLASG